MLETVLGTDTGCEAIKKLDRNDKKLLEQMKEVSGQNTSLSEQINVLKDKVEWKARNWKNENALPSEFQIETQTMFYSNDSTWNGKRYVIIRVSKYTDTTVFQEVLDCNTGSVIMYRCSSTSEKWTTWETTATTTKTDILITPRPKKTIVYNNSYKDSMGFVVDVRVKNTDDSDIPVGYDAWFDGLPYIGDVYKPISAICLNASGAYAGECGGYRWGSGVYLYPSVVCKSIAVYDRCGGV